VNDNSLSATWSQVTALIDAGYSLMPVRDKEEMVNGRLRPAKSPYGFWKSNQTQRLTAAELWEAMDKLGTTAIAVVCGKVSGNLEAIDLDIKWKPGADALLFKNIKDLYPYLWEKLRLHKSPSGGYHILYRIIDGPPPGNRHLAKRLTTTEEKEDWLAEHPDKTKAPSEVAFFETRGEGGYVLFPPSLGYSIYKAQPIPLLTALERNSLINLCISFNEVIKKEKEPKLAKREDDYYDVNPFEHFNRSEEGKRVLVTFGWQVNGENGEFAWFTKPGSRSGERHATWIKKKSLFWFWTTQSEFDSERCKSPATVLNTLGFGGDWKATYKDLVKRGYGRIKPTVEARIIRTAKELPSNISEAGKEAYKALIRERTEAHPHGTFWAVEPEGRITIDREAMYRISGELGFFLYGQEVVQLRSPGFLYRITERMYFDELKRYIKEKDDELRNDIINTYEHFLQVAGTFTITRLPLLDESKIITDTPRYCYKFFENVYIRIGANTVEEIDYEDLNEYVWADKVMPRKFQRSETGRYIDFLDKALDYKRMKDHVLKVIGYLAHEYKDETTGYIIVMTESCPDPREGGGSGKNLFCNLFKLITSVATRPGEQIKYDEKFFQSWNGEKIFVISDAPKDFKFLFLKELSTGSGVLKKLWRNEEEVTVERLPKIIVNTNYSYEILDGGLRRRIIPLEFTDFFTRNNGVSRYYSAYFPRDWEEEDWNGYNWIMVEGIQRWLRSNLILEPPKLTIGGWRKQFEQSYGHVATDFITTSFDKWMEEEYLPNSVLKNELEEYCEERNINKLYRPSIYKVNAALEAYGERMGVLVVSDVQRKIGGVNVKCKIFSKTIPTPEAKLPPELEENNDILFL
jgi:hypothetical protein